MLCTCPGNMLIKIEMKMCGNMFCCHITYTKLKDVISYDATQWPQDNTFSQRNNVFTLQQQFSQHKNFSHNQQLSHNTTICFRNQ